MLMPYKDIVLGLLRHLLTAGGGWLIAHGYAAAGTLSPDVISGLAVFLVGVGWSVLQKIQAQRKVQEGLDSAWSVWQEVEAERKVQEGRA